jgi:RNA polymerase sigma-70 factor (ECF subfamily)
VNGALADRTDGELVALALGGRQAAFAEIVSRHKQPLHRLIARVIGDEDEALDILQEVFVSAHASLRRFDIGRPMRAWLARIAINKARDWRRRRAVRRLISAVLPIEHASQVAADQPATDTLAADREELRQVGAAIATLPANLRETLVLRAIEGMSQAEAAEALGISEKAVETRLYRARQRLAAEIDRQR